MKFVLIVIGILLCFWMIPVTLFLIKRIKMYLRLKSECKKSGATIKGSHKLWIFGRKNSSSSDFQIDIYKKVYSVKLFSINSRRAVLVFNGNGSYFIRKYLGFIGNTGARAVLSDDTKLKKIPEYDFKKNFCQDWDTKELIPVLLVYPSRHDLLYQVSVDKLRPIEAGETINGMMVTGLPDLLHQII